MSNHQTSQSEIVHGLKKFGRSDSKFCFFFFKVVIKNVKLKFSGKSVRILAHENTQGFFNVKIRKQTDHGVY